MVARSSSSLTAWLNARITRSSLRSISMPQMPVARVVWRTTTATSSGGVAGKTTRSELPWDGSLKAPGYQDRLLRDDPLKPGEKRTIQSFDPQFGKSSVITLEAKGEEEVPLLADEKRKLLRVSIASSVAPRIVLDEYLDAKGDPLVTRMSLLGIAIYKVSREEALKWTTRFMELHQQHWPEFEGETQIRQMFEPGDFPKH